MRHILSYNNTSLASGLISYYKLDLNSNDSVGSNNGTDVDITYSVGKIKNAATFSTNSSKITISNLNINASVTRTISCWFKLSKFPVVLFTGDVLASGYLAAITETYHYCDDHFTTLIFNHSFLLNTWHHLVLTFNNGVVRSYLDGVESTSGALSMNPSGYFNTQIFGGYGSALFNLIGQMDEVGIWSRVLSQSEILYLYNNGSGSQYPFPRILKYNNSIESGVVSCWKFENNSKDLISLNNGTDSNIVYSNGMFGKAALFNGSTSYIISNSYNNIPYGTSPITISCWFKATSNGQTYQFLVSIGDNSTNGGRYSLVIKNGFLMANFFNTEFVSTYSVLDGQWHLAVLTFNGNTTSVTLNLDNLPSQTGSLSPSITPNIVQGNIVFGSDNYLLPTSPSWVLNGLLDETIVWNRVLTQNEISQIYNGGYGSQYPFSKMFKFEFLPETIAFMTATQISNDETMYGNVSGRQMWGYVDDHIRNLKGQGSINSKFNFWDKYVALYPFVGGTASSHKWNLKNPTDSDSAFRITWTGSTANNIQHGFSGVTGGDPTRYGETHLVPSADLSLNDTSIFRYSNSFPTTDIYEMGIFGGSGSGYLYMRTSFSSNPLDNGVNGVSFATTPQPGYVSKFRLLSRVSSTEFKNYVEDTLHSTVSNNSGTLSNESFPILGLKDNGIVTISSNARYTYIGIGKGITDEEESVLYNIITRLQNQLLRA